MTEDSATRQRGIVCDECNQPVVCDRTERGLLHMTCGCNVARSIKVAAKLPAGWSE